MGGEALGGVEFNCMTGDCGCVKLEYYHSSLECPVVDVLHTMSFGLHTSPLHSVHDAVECLVSSLAAGLQCVSCVAGCHCLVFPAALQAIHLSQQYSVVCIP